MNGTPENVPEPADAGQCSAVLPEPGRPAARQWLDRAAAGEITMLAPDLILVEFASLVETRPRLDAALGLSVEYGSSLRDCVPVVPAIECECPCLTVDKRWLRSPVGKYARLRLLE